VDIWRREQQGGEVGKEADGDYRQAGIWGGGEGGAVEIYRFSGFGGEVEGAREVVRDFAGVFS